MLEESDHLPDDELRPYQLLEVDQFSYFDPIAVTPLLSCLGCESTKKLITFLQKGQNPNIVDNHGNNFIHYAAVQGRLDVINLAKKHSKYPLQLSSRNWMGETCLFQALSRDCPYALAESLIDMDRSLINIPNNENTTPLHKAVLYRSNIKIVELLLKLGADVNAVDFDDCTPLHEAIVTGNWNIVRLLIFYGADCSIEAAKTKVIPFMLALHMGAPMDVLENIFWHTCEEVFPDVNLDDLECVILHGTAEMFDLFLSKFVPNKRVSDNDVLRNLAKNRLFSNEDWLQCFYKLMDKEMDLKLITYAYPFLSHLEETFSSRQIEVEEGVKLLYALLSYSPPFTFNDIAVFYDNPTLSPYVEVFINVNPSFTIGHRIHDKECIELCFIMDSRHECFVTLREMILEKEYRNARSGICASLLDITRNAIKKLIDHHLLEYREIGVFDYIHAVRSLKLPNSLKNMLLFRN